MERKGASIGDKIDHIFSESNNINEIESKIIHLFTKNAKDIQTNQPPNTEKVDVAKNIYRR